MTTPISDKIHHALSQIDNSLLAQDIWLILQEQKFVGFLPHFAVQHLCNKHQITPQQLSLQLLPIAACYATTPISHFNVGAIATGVSGSFYFGANQEFSNSAIQQTIHAEQSAISHAWLRNERRISDMVVNYTPCGHCRQFMNELHGAEKISIHLPHSQNNLLHSYLPDAFGPKDLDIAVHLLAEENHDLVADHQDDLVNQAILAANQSHCPYSNSPHGIAILFKNGDVVTGRYAENAAFNPSLPALQTALNFAYLNDKKLRYKGEK